MMRRRLMLPTFILLACLTACQSSQVAGNGNDADPVDARLSAGYSLLHSLVKDESGVAGILSVKQASDETTAIIKDIAAASHDARKQLEAFAQADARIVLDRPQLPEVEQSTRGSIALATGGGLLFAGDFELRLLLTQLDALQYGQHMAEQVARMDGDEERSQWLREFSKRYADLRKRVIERLALRG